MITLHYQLGFVCLDILHCIISQLVLFIISLSSSSCEHLSIYHMNNQEERKEIFQANLSNNHHYSRSSFSNPIHHITLFHKEQSTVFSQLHEQLGHNPKAQSNILTRFWIILNFLHFIFLEGKFGFIFFYSSCWFTSYCNKNMFVDCYVGDLNSLYSALWGIDSVWMDNLSRRTGG